MKLRKVLGIFGAMIAALSMTACGHSESAPVQTENITVAGEVTSADMAADTIADTADTAADMTADTAEIEVMFWTLNTVPSDLKMVEAAINDITEKKINTTIHLNIIEMGNYIQQVNLMMSGNEKLDLVVTLPGGSAHFNSMSAQNQLMDIKDLLEKYAVDLLKVVPESWLAATTIDDRTYAVTSYGDKATPLYFSCRTDILEQTGINAASIKTANDLEMLFAKVRQVQPDIVPVAADNKKLLTAPYMIDANGSFIKYDGLGDGDNCLVGIMDGDNTTIRNNYLRQ